VERFEDQAVVLGAVSYGEADRVVTLFTRSRGKLSAFAPHARKSQRRFAGALEPMTLLQARLTERTGSTLRLDGVDVVNSFFRLREELPLMARGLYAVELCRELTREHEPHLELFERLVEYLGALEERKAGPTSLLLFELDVLSLVGFRPRLDVCGGCGADYGAHGQFNPEHGGVLCRACAGGGNLGEAPTLRALAGLQAGVREPLAPEVRARARNLLNLFIEHQVGHRLKSVEFMRQVGVD
jgi:DNA repair protein RecO (recombination protein O)